MRERRSHPSFPLNYYGENFDVHQEKGVLVVHLQPQFQSPFHHTVEVNKLRAEMKKTVKSETLRLCQLREMPHHA